QYRAELLARAAPVGPQIQDHRHRPGPLDDLRVEGLLGHVEDIAARRARLPAGARCRLLTALRGRLPRTQVNGAVKRKVPRLLHTSILPHASHALTAPGTADHISSTKAPAPPVPPGQPAASQILHQMREEERY